MDWKRLRWTRDEVVWAAVLVVIAILGMVVWDHFS
jgi:predicted negative regulator of RcsB-dependent stress response